MAAKKSKRNNIQLQSTESSYSTTTSVNKANTPGKLELKKYDPTLRKHVLFKEKKIK